MLGYGTAALSGSKHPEKAAMYSGLASMPFSFMKAQGAANAYNKKYAGAGAADLYKTHGTKIMTDPGAAGYWDEPASEWIDAIKPSYGKLRGAPWSIPKDFQQPTKIDAWDVLKGKEYNIPAMRDMAMAPTGEAIWNEEAQRFAWPEGSMWEASQKRLPAQTVTPAEDVNFYSKIGKGEKNLLGQTLEKGETFTDWTPTIASQTAGWYGGRPTSEELWDDAKKRRRKELAFMYGIPEELMGGEMENPYYTGGGFWKDGGLASLEMDQGGAVNGPGGPKDDVIDAKLSDGEFVMTAKAVENLGGGNRLAGAKQMYNMMNQLDPQSETVQESVIGV